MIGFLIGPWLALYGVAGVRCQPGWREPAAMLITCLVCAGTESLVPRGAREEFPLLARAARFGAPFLGLFLAAHFPTVVPHLTFDSLQALGCTAVVAALAATRTGFTLPLAVTAFAGLWLAQAVLGGVALTGDGRLGTLAVLALVCSVGGSTFTPILVDRLSRLVAVVVLILVGGAVELAVLLRLDRFTTASLRVDGGGWFLAAAGVLCLATAIACLIEQMQLRRIVEQEIAARYSMAEAHHAAAMQLTMLSAQSAVDWAERARRRY